MGFRRSPNRIAAARDWRRFVDHNVTLLHAAGLPSAVVDSVASWDDFLTHGYAVAEPGEFGVEQLDRDQYAALVQLALNYFAAGYEFYTPVALRADDQASLRIRFGSPP